MKRQKGSNLLVEVDLALDLERETGPAERSLRLFQAQNFTFAQFEREVTSERIRDKISASKRKWLWVGGMAPLGYDTKGRAGKSPFA